MDFDRIIRNADHSSEKEVVGLGFYYLDELKGEAPVSPSDVKGLIKKTRTDIPEQNIAAYPSQISDDGYVTKRDGGYVLTHEGQDYYDTLFDLPDLPDEPRTDRFLNVDSEERFYSDLIEDINKSYQSRIYDATLVLTRKLFESLLIDILRGHYGNQQIQMFFNPDRAMYHPFSVLLGNLEENIDDFQHYSLSLDDEFVNSLDGFRVDANKSAHSVETDISESEIENLSDKASNISKILLNVWKKVQIANQN